MIDPMLDIPEIDVHGAKALLDAGGASFVDIRDQQAYAAGHVPGAAHLTNHTLQQVMGSLERERRIVVYCYHGNSSRNATAWLLGQGFTDVASMSGGFEAWRIAYPMTSEGGAQ